LDEIGMNSTLQTTCGEVTPPPPAPTGTGIHVIDTMPCATLSSLRIPAAALNRRGNVAYTRWTLCPKWTATVWVLELRNMS
jgi:hypothetical protein